MARRPNRSIPDASVIPVLSYPDPGEAAEWLAKAFGLGVRLRIFDHRVQMTFDGGALVTTDSHWTGPEAANSSHSVMLRVDDAAAVWDRAIALGATGVMPPRDFDYGERQADLADPWGHRWTLSQTTGDVDPGDWGGRVEGDA